MELLEINTHFSLCFIINGVTAMLWQLQLTIGKRKNPQDWGSGKSWWIHTAYILNISASLLFSLALFESFCPSSVFFFSSFC